MHMFKKHEENYIQGHHNQMFKTQNKGKNLKSNQRKETNHTEKNNSLDDRFPVRNNIGKKTAGEASLKS